LITSYSDVVAFLKSSEIDPVIRLILIDIGVETEYISVVRTLSRRGPKGELNASIVTESEITNFLLLKLIRRPDSFMIAIGV
jgi:hypothetical protein